MFTFLILLTIGAATFIGVYSVLTGRNWVAIVISAVMAIGFSVAAFITFLKSPR